MIAAVVHEDIVENLIVINDDQIEEMQAALGCELVDARPYGLAMGDLRTERGWTRNDGGEQIVLPLLEQEHADSYNMAMQRADAAEQNAAMLERELAACDTAYLQGVNEA